MMVHSAAQEGVFIPTAEPHPPVVAGSMLEKMAAAIEATGLIGRTPYLLPGNDKATAIARAALLAIREPNPPGAAAGQWSWLRNVMGFTSPTPPVRECVEANAAATKTYTAMIDAILSGRA